MTPEAMTTTVRWIGIIIVLMMLLAGWVYGAVQGSTLAQVRVQMTQIQINEAAINELKTQYSVIINELVHVNRKLDNLAAANEH